jgi:hypothetical protein
MPEAPEEYQQHDHYSGRRIVQRDERIAKSVTRCVRCGRVLTWVTVYCRCGEHNV